MGRHASPPQPCRAFGLPLAVRHARDAQIDRVAIRALHHQLLVAVLNRSCSPSLSIGQRRASRCSSDRQDRSLRCPDDPSAAAVLPVSEVRSSTWWSPVRCSESIAPPTLDVPRSSKYDAGHRVQVTVSLPLAMWPVKASCSPTVVWCSVPGTTSCAVCAESSRERDEQTVPTVIL